MVYRVAIISIHPGFIGSYFDFGVCRAAIQKNLVKIENINLRDFAVDKHGSIDDKPYGIGEGMVLRPEPLADAIKSIAPRPHVILTTPIGKPWKQSDAQRLAKITGPLAIICGRFGGIDERFIENYVQENFSIGDFIISGGELAAMIMLDSILRQIPEVLGNENSAGNDSFGEGYDGLLEHPLYTRPPMFEGKGVPEVLLSGDHKKIKEWQQKTARERTATLRPDLLSGRRREP